MLTKLISSRKIKQVYFLNVSSYFERVELNFKVNYKLIPESFYWKLQKIVRSRGSKLENLFILNLQYLTGQIIIIIPSGRIETSSFMSHIFFPPIDPDT